MILLVRRIGDRGEVAVGVDVQCERRFPTTGLRDDDVKAPDLRRPYAQVGVPYLWVVDPDAKLLTARRLEGGSWVELGVWADETSARIPPFDAVELDVSEWWVATEEAGG